MTESDETPASSDASWLQQIVNGRDGFESEAVARFSDRLLRLAGAKMSPRLAQRVDPEDIVQSVFRSFFRRHSEKEFEFEQANDVWRLLAAITYRKTMQAARFHQRKQRDINRERAEPQDGNQDLANPDSPTASALATMQDLLDSILSKLPETHHEILLLRLEQYSIEEIASRVEVSTRTVNRTLALVRTIAQQLCEQD